MNSFEITVNAMGVIEERSGESAKGTWVNAKLLAKTQEQYPRDVVFSIWGEEKIEQCKKLAANQEVTVVFSLASSCYNNRYYNDVRLSSIKNPFIQAPQPQQVQYQQPPQQMPMAPMAQAQPVDYQEVGTIEQSASIPQKDDDLPF